jgi:hypothetical protein
METEMNTIASAAAATAAAYASASPEVQAVIDSLIEQNRELRLAQDDRWDAGYRAGWNQGLRDATDGKW